MGLFRREDNGEVIELSFEKTMQQDAAGFITLDDGVIARRCVHLEIEKKPKVGKASSVAPPIISDALGFPQQQFADFERDRIANGFVGTEFIRDPQVPEFFQAKFASYKERDRYMKHRNNVDRNSRNGGGGAFTPEMMASAEEFIRRLRPVDSEKSGIVLVDEDA